MRNLKILYALPLLLILLFGKVNSAKAQGADAYFGLGTAQDKSTGQSINTFGDGVLYPTPALGGVLGKFGADFMLRPTLGVGGEYDFRFNQGSYAGLNYRPSFYDFNVIWMPNTIERKVIPEFQAGVGGANLKFYYTQRFCDVFAGCSTSNTLLESSNHFQTHLSAGIRLYARGGIFIRPQIDVRYVHNFFQFGHNWVPEYGVSIGYTFGRP